MPFGAVFTSSAGGDIGGGRLRTRFRGPILAGYASTADPGGQTMGALSSAPAGSAPQPMYSYYLRPDMGFYAASVTTAAPDMRFSQSGLDVFSWSSAQIGLVGSSQAAGTPLVAAAGLVGASSAAVVGFYLPQTTYAMSSSTNANIASTPTATNSGAIMVYDSLRKKISVYSTVLGDWLSVTLSSS